jgi:predicted metal-dependent RNase
MRWLGTFPATPGRVCLVHGEPEPMDALKTLMQQRLGWTAETPQHLQRLSL